MHQLFTIREVSEFKNLRSPHAGPSFTSSLRNLSNFKFESDVDDDRGMPKSIGLEPVAEAVDNT